MIVFDKYADYYDLIYNKKDYLKEVDYVNTLIDKYSSNVKSILELGCGTGVHAALLAEKGYTVHGIDSSDSMLKIAKERWSKLPNNISEKIKSTKCDIKDFILEDRYDVVLSLFHVISYLPNNNDIAAVFNRVKNHLNKGGLFIFDCWYGPGVINDLPKFSTNSYENESMLVNRISKPEVYPNENLVDVKYKINVINKETNNSQIINETHRMRYLFNPEVELFLKSNNMHKLGLFDWMTPEKPSFSSWNAVFIARLN